MNILRFLSENWVDILLIIVGTLALVIYILQERRKVTEAASLVVQQIGELQERIKEIQSYIVDGQLNETAFYESTILLGEDYWNRYKHYFVRKIDSQSYRTLNSLYDCASEIQEQQQLMKSLQKNFFFVTQQVFANLETNYIVTGLNDSTSHPIDMEKVVSGLAQNMPQNLDSQQQESIENMLRQVAISSGNVDFSLFWKNYNQNRMNIRAVIDQKALTPYTPLQIRLSLENALKQYALLEIIGCDGFKKLEKLARRKF